MASYQAYTHVPYYQIGGFAPGGSDPVAAAVISEITFQGGLADEQAFIQHVRDFFESYGSVTEVTIQKTEINQSFV